MVCEGLCARVLDLGRLFLASTLACPAGVKCLSISSNTPSRSSRIALLSKRSTRSPRRSNHSSLSLSYSSLPGSSCMPPSISITSFSSGQWKSTTYGPKPSCRLNFLPASFLPFSSFQSTASLGVPSFRNSLRKCFCSARFRTCIMCPVKLTTPNPSYAASKTRRHRRGDLTPDPSYAASKTRLHRRGDDPCNSVRHSSTTYSCLPSCSEALRGIGGVGGGARCITPRLVFAASSRRCGSPPPSPLPPSDR